MDENESITSAADNQSETTQSDQQETDQQTLNAEDNLDNTSESTDTSADDNTKSDTDENGDGSASQFDSDLDEWAKKTGRPQPTTDRERELYQEIRNGQREYSRQRQKETQNSLDKAIKDTKPADDINDDLDDRDIAEKRQDAFESRLAEFEARAARAEYFSESNVSKQEADMMGEILQEKVAKGGKSAFDYWTHPDQLADWHALAKARLAGTQDTSVIAEEAARKERERIAKESHAAGSARSASTTTVQKPKGYDRTAFLASDED